MTARMMSMFVIALVTGCAGASHTGPAVMPGLSLGAWRTPGPDTVVYRRTITRAGHDTAAGTRTVVLRILRGPSDTRFLEVEQRFPGGGGEIVDTALAELHTWRAVAHRSHQPARTMRFDFSDGEARGTVDTATVRQAIGGPIFDSNVLDLVTAALPLAPQYRTELPFFIYERGGRVPMLVAVRERARVVFPSLGEREAWIVEIAVPGAPATIWVDTRTRAVLRVRYDITARATSFTDDRVTPLRG